MSTPNEYQMIHRLGSGPAGPVYVSRSASGLAALRQFVSRAAPHSTVWLQERQRFLEAGQRGEGLKHPHIVPVREVIDEGENAFVVMEYVTSGAVDGAKVPPPAGTLDQALSARAFSEPEILTLLGEIAAALDYAHKQGVVHGDLKPKDVFLIDGQGAKVADFAISPRAALIPGTPVPTRWSHPYLSPEHLSGARVGRKADQYSLAVIAYQMYTGKLPGGRPDSPGPGPAPASDSAATLATLPARVTAALDQALNRDPDRRFSSCQEFVSALSGRTHRGRYVLLGLVALAALGWFALSRSPRPVGPVAGKVS
ncbi:MAG: serine/threonine-protein kinase, partial [Acidobacteria bacterium]|nr:serine/threonine-protein kinase [Acidobacteriota bacterium]